MKVSAKGAGEQIVIPSDILQQDSWAGQNENLEGPTGGGFQQRSQWYRQQRRRNASRYMENQVQDARSRLRPSGAKCQKGLD